MHTLYSILLDSPSKTHTTQQLNIIHKVLEKYYTIPDINYILEMIKFFLIYINKQIRI